MRLGLEPRPYQRHRLVALAALLVGVGQEGAQTLVLIALGESDPATLSPVKGFVGIARAAIEFGELQEIVGPRQIARHDRGARFKIAIPLRDRLHNRGDAEAPAVALAVIRAGRERLDLGPLRLRQLAEGRAPGSPRMSA